MSGGHFDYKNYYIDDIVDSIENYVDGRPIDIHDIDITDLKYIDKEEKEYIEKYGRSLPNCYDFSKDTIAVFKEAINTLKKAAIYTQRIDYLLSGDDSEETFHERLHEELKNLECK